MPAAKDGGAVETQAMDAWVSEQLATFAPLGPADLVVLAAILGYNVADVVSDEAA
jgi:hypothetical protein